MFMWNFDDEKQISSQDDSFFDLVILWQLAPSRWWLIVHMFWNHSSSSFSWIFPNLYTYFTDIVKMCMWEFDAERILYDKMTGFLTAILRQLHLVDFS